MTFKNIKYVLTDIEGTTTSVQFVYDVLFPYFRENISKIKDHLDNEEVQIAIKKTVELAAQLEKRKLDSIEKVLETLHKWSLEDRKLTPLKTLQGIIWRKGYEEGEIKGHVYDDVLPNIEKWHKSNIEIGIFSSGSISAQKLLFGHSLSGDLSPYFNHYFDTLTGGKREVETYRKIVQEIGHPSNEILFLSDVVEELEAAQEAGLHTLQLVRKGTEQKWPQSVASFDQINIQN